MQSIFGSRFISLKTDFEWPPGSCDLNTCDYYAWPCMKNNVFKGRTFSDTHDGTVELKSAVEKEILSMNSPENRQKIYNVCTRSFIERLKMVQLVNGKTFAKIKSDLKKHLNE